MYEDKWEYDSSTRYSEQQNIDDEEDLPQKDLPTVDDVDFDKNEHKEFNPTI